MTIFQLELFLIALTGTNMAGLAYLVDFQIGAWYGLVMFCAITFVRRVLTQDLLDEFFQRRDRSRGWEE